MKNDILKSSYEYEKLGQEQKINKIARIFRHFSPEILFIFIIQNLCALMSLYQAYLIHEIMQFLEFDVREQKDGITLIVKLLLLRLALLLTKNFTSYYQKTTSFEIVKAIVQEIGIKLLKQPQSSTDQNNSNMVSLISTDAQQILSHFAIFCESFGIPLQIILSLYFLFIFIGYTFIVGLLVMILTLVANSYIGKALSKNQTKLMALQDQRVRRSKEIFSKINLVKSYMLQEQSLRKLLALKTIELVAVYDYLYILAYQCFVVWLSPQLIILAALMGKIQAGEQLTLSYTFTIICLIQTLQLPLQLLTSVVGSGVQLHTSSNRIEKFFNQEEMPDQSQNADQLLDQCTTNESQYSIYIKNATFYLNNETELLKNINLNITQGQFISIIGPIGSGKTSLLLGILGELGSSYDTIVAVNGRIAYVSQNPWLLNVSIRENILMGQQFDEQKYQAAVEMSCLQQDLLTMSEQDNTMAGEGGKNISGGQRTRVSLARALYSDADIYLFDDCLSGLDAQVANQIFNNCFINHLKTKTRVLVTHSVEYCKFTDQIVVLENGCIANKSQTNLDQVFNFEDQQQSQQVEYQLPQPVNPEVLQEQSQQPTSIFNGMKSIFDLGIIINSKLVVYAILLVVFYTLAAVWLSIWSHEEPQKQFDDRQYFMMIFIILSLLQALMAFFRNGIAADMNVQLGEQVHTSMINSLLGAHINNFFNKVPIGRILNRLSIEMISIDTKIGINYCSLLTKVGQLIANCALYVISSNILLAGVLALYVAFCSKLQIEYLAAVKLLQTQEKKAQGHLVSLFSELQSVLHIIRAYSAQPYILNEITSRVDLNKKFYILQAYLQLKLKCILCTTSLLINTLTLGYIMFYSTDYLLAGIVLTYAFRLDMNITIALELQSQLQNNVISLTRCLEYTKIPPEDPIVVEERNEVEITEGSIRFVNVSLRYSENAPNALSNVNLEIEPGMKVGIIGRTGAGKSSMMQCLLRSVDITQGEIWLDSYELSSLPLSQLRKIITLIAQDPIMMEGTLRENLDPFNKYSDQFINEVIESCGLKQIVESKGGLETKISVNADEFSKGEKQLLSIARAVLKNTKIILIDEATSNLNAEADLKIQETIKEVFKDRTVITIAHRLNTVLCCDKIAIMEQGQVMEFNTPAELMKDKEQYLYQMLQQQDTKDM